MSKKVLVNKIFNSELHGWVVILFGVVGFFIWAAFYPIDQGIRTSGFVISTGRIVNVTSSIAGKVKNIYKNNGDHVVAGDLIMDLSIRPVEPKERDLFNVIRLLEEANLSLTDAYLSRKQQVMALESQYEATNKLLLSGFATKSFLSSIEVQLTTAKSDRSEIKSRILENESKLRDLKEKIGAIKVAPASGILNQIGLNKQDEFQVGDILFSVQPISTSLLIGVQIPVDYASQIRNGLGTSIMFPSLPGASTLFFEGRLEHISYDRKVDEKTNLSYFEGLVSAPYSQQADELIVKTGLPVVVIIKAGRRTLLSYIVRPLSERISRGLH